MPYFKRNPDLLNNVTLFLLPHSEMIHLKLLVSDSVGCRSWSNHQWTAATLTSLCRSLQRQMERRTSLAHLSGTTSAAMERRPDTFLDVILKPPVSLRPFFHVYYCTPITWARAKSFPARCYLLWAKLLAPARASLILHGTRKGQSWSLFFLPRS